jgi:hypothetical protein
VCYGSSLDDEFSREAFCGHQCHIGLQSEKVPSGRLVTLLAQGQYPFFAQRNNNSNWKGRDEEEDPGKDGEK